GGVVRHAVAWRTSRSSGPARATNAAAVRIQAHREAGTLSRSGRSPKLAAFVARNGPLDHFVCFANRFLPSLRHLPPFRRFAPKGICRMLRVARRNASLEIPGQLNNLEPRSARKRSTGSY